MLIKLVSSRCIDRRSTRSIKHTTTDMSIRNTTHTTMGTSTGSTKNTTMDMNTRDMDVNTHTIMPWKKIFQLGKR